MKTRLSDNGWTVFIDEDIKSLSDEDVVGVARLVVKNMVVVFENQQMSPIQQYTFCNRIGNVHKTGADISVIPGVIRVTGQKNLRGKPGLFGHKHALDWHANQPSAPDRKPLIWLYGHKGTAGSRTSWINNIVAYNALDDDFKKEIEDIEVFYGYQQGNFSDSDYFKNHVNRQNPLKLVRVNEEGQKGLFFPFLQMFEFKDKSKQYYNDVMARLTKHVLQDQYRYDHFWKDGDIVISEQWLSIHKRWAFDGMDQRVLYRIAFDHSHIYRGNHER